MPIKFEKLGHVYSTGTPFEYEALKDVNLDIDEGKMTAVIGRTGCGKSTLVQHLNALLLPTSGKLEVAGRTISAGDKTKGLKSLRGDVGLVFQFPEYQLFEETILKDVSFGPKNFGVSEEEAVKKAREALRLVGLDSSYEERSPLELSGGQKRRVAIAGILAMDPEILVLDEPTAGLDPKGTIAMMQLFYTLNHKYGKTIIIVTHDMEQVYKFCDSVVVIEEGTVRLHASVKEFFKDSKYCMEMNILAPALVRLKDELIERGFKIDDSVMTIEGMAAAIAKQVKKHG